MKKNIVILGSTGSIGKSLLSIIKKNKKFFNIILLTANTDYKTLFNQAKKFKVKNLIITDKDCFKILKEKCKKKILMFIITLIILIKFLKKKLITR